MGFIMMMDWPFEKQKWTTIRTSNEKHPKNIYGTWARYYLTV